LMLVLNEYNNTKNINQSYTTPLNIFNLILQKLARLEWGKKGLPLLSLPLFHIYIYI
jgi:hypothetical protein